VSGTVVVVGNPKAASRTLSVAVDIAERVSGGAPDLVIDLATVGAKLLDWSDSEATALVTAVQSADVAVIASPTYKASFSGLLKLFLDRFGAGSMAGVLTVPVMVGAGDVHALAVEVFLKPVLAELGASCVGPGIFVREKDIGNPEWAPPGLDLLQAQVATLRANPAWRQRG
jgi:FMN reductase